jgi:hypothetical protein
MYEALVACVNFLHQGRINPMVCTHSLTTRFHTLPETRAPLESQAFEFSCCLGMEVVGALCTSFPKTVTRLRALAAWGGNPDAATPVRLDECDNYLVHSTIQLQPVKRLCLRCDTVHLHLGNPIRIDPVLSLMHSR